MKKNADFSKIITKAHENKWVALSPKRDKVLGASQNLMDLKRRVKDQNVVYTKVLPRDTTFAF